MRFRRIVPVLTALGVLSPHVGGDVIPFTFHSFCGSALANVFDGGPPEYAAGCFLNPPLPWGAEVLAADDTETPGSLGAFARALAGSSVFSSQAEWGVNIRFSAGYYPSGFPGGDNPGGMAEAHMVSVIEFVMPVDELGWRYWLRIDEDSPFQGRTSIVIDNVTQSSNILTLTDETYFVATTLKGDAGDLIRITSDISGHGTMGPGSDRNYSSDLDMYFIPEPSTNVMLLAATLCVGRRGQRQKD